MHEIGTGNQVDACKAGYEKRLAVLHDEGARANWQVGQQTGHLFLRQQVYELIIADGARCIVQPETFGEVLGHRVQSLGKLDFRCSRLKFKAAAGQRQHFVGA
jgi:hypothetical protein